MKKLIEKDKRIVVMSLRLPVAKTTDANGKIVWKRTVGGMATVVKQSLSLSSNQKNPALWLGWLGDFGNSFQPLIPSKYFHILSVKIPKKEFTNCYNNFSNMGIWPVFHGFEEKILGNISKIRSGWPDYVSVNKRFANEYLKVAKEKDKIIVHDYQLALVAQNLKMRHFKNSITYFLHIPFPKTEIFFQLPHAKQLLKALLSYDEIGFQTEKDMKNFEACATYAKTKEKLPKLAVIPVSVNPKEFAKIVKKPQVKKWAAEIRRKYKNKKIIFSAGRLDYTKGFIESIKAFKKTLNNNPLLIAKTVFMIAASRSRESIAAYQQYAQELDKEVARVNSEFKIKDYKPIVLLPGISQEQVVAHYISCNVYLAGSLADGMNLTPLEATAVLQKQSGNPVIIVGKGAGVSRQLTGAIAFDAKSSKEQSNAILQALSMEKDERIARMKANKASLRANTIEDWTKHLLNFEVYKPYPKKNKNPKINLRKNSTKFQTRNLDLQNYSKIL